MDKKIGKTLGTGPAETEIEIQSSLVARRGCINPKNEAEDLPFQTTQPD